MYNYGSSKVWKQNIPTSLNTLDRQLITNRYIFSSNFAKEELWHSKSEKTGQQTITKLASLKFSFFSNSFSKGWSFLINTVTIDKN